MMGVLPALAVVAALPAPGEGGAAAAEEVGAGGFGLFSTGHLVTVGICCAVIAVLVVLGRWWRGSPRERVLRRAWAYPIFITQITGIVYWFLPPNFEWGISLPLQVCDISAIIAPFALLTQNRLCRTILFFWGLVMSWVAFVIPALERGPGELAFWLFWVGHTQILGSALYDVAVLRYRPLWRDYAWMLIPNLLGLVVVVPLNLIAGTNYWYIGQDITPGSPVGRFGAWPWRIFPIVVTVLLVQAVATAGFQVFSRLTRRRDRRAPAPGQPADRSGGASSEGAAAPGRIGS